MLPIIAALKVLFSIASGIFILVSFCINPETKHKPDSLVLSYIAIVSLAILLLMSKIENDIYLEGIYNNTYQIVPDNCNFEHNGSIKGCSYIVIEKP